MTPAKSASWFTRFSKLVARVTGQPISFGLAVLVILVWAITGPMFQWSDTWQLIVNTGTTIVTFLMVFLIQSTQNRDSEAMQIKLDELIRCVEGAQEALLDLEEMEERELHAVRAKYEELAATARESMRDGPLADILDISQVGPTKGSAV